MQKCNVVIGAVLGAAAATAAFLFLKRRVPRMPPRTLRRRNPGTFLNIAYGDLK